MTSLYYIQVISQVVLVFVCCCLGDVSVHRALSIEILHIYSATTVTGLT